MDPGDRGHHFSGHNQNRGYPGQHSEFYPNQQFRFSSYNHFQDHHPGNSDRRNWAEDSWEGWDSMKHSHSHQSFQNPRFGGPFGGHGFRGDCPPQYSNYSRPVQRYSEAHQFPRRPFFNERNLQILNGSNMADIAGPSHPRKPQQGAPGARGGRGGSGPPSRHYGLKREMPSGRSSRNSWPDDPHHSAPQPQAIKLPPPPDPAEEQRKELVNKVKESLKQMKANQTGQSSQSAGAEGPSEHTESSSTPASQSLPAIVPADPGELALTTEEWKSIGRRKSGSGQAATSPSTSDPNRLLEGIGYISNTGSDLPSTPKSQVGVRRKSSDCSGSPRVDGIVPLPPSAERNLRTAGTKEQVVQNILALDNPQKRRQYVDQPPPNVSSILDELVRENVTAQARQLTTMRFRQINPDQHLLYNDLGSALTAGDVASAGIESGQEAFIDQVNKLFNEDDEDIQVLEPPTKELPPCIDLDDDVDCYASSSPGSDPQMPAPPTGTGYSAVVDSVPPDEGTVMPPIPAAEPARPRASPPREADAPQVTPLVTMSVQGAAPNPPSATSTAPRGSGECGRLPPASLATLFRESESLERQLSDIDQRVEELNAQRKLLQARYTVVQKQLRAHVVPSMSASATSSACAPVADYTPPVDPPAPDPPTPEPSAAAAAAPPSRVESPRGRHAVAPPEAGSARDSPSPSVSEKVDSNKKRKRLSDKAAAAAQASGPAKKSATASPDKSRKKRNGHSFSPSLNHLEPHRTSVRCMWARGPCLFTASMDRTVHVYDLTSGDLLMRILGHPETVTCLQSRTQPTASKTSQDMTTSDYLQHVHLITGSLDGCVRQFSLATGNLVHEVTCQHPVTCMVPSKLQGSFLVGSTRGFIYIYNPKGNTLKVANFQAESEVLSMKVTRMMDARVIILASKNSPPVIRDLRSGVLLFTLSTSDDSFVSISCLATLDDRVYYCDSIRHVYVFETSNSLKSLTKVIELPSYCVSAQHDGVRLLYLACNDGLIRTYDTKAQDFVDSPPVSVTAKKQLTTMHLTDEKIVCGSASGEVTWISIGDLHPHAEHHSP